MSKVTEKECVDIIQKIMDSMHVHNYDKSGDFHTTDEYKGLIKDVSDILEKDKPLKVDDPITYTVNILGTVYTVYEHENVDGIEEFRTMDGWCDTTVKEIHTRKMVQDENDPEQVRDVSVINKKIIRHEILHAFMYESGNDSENWGADEDLIDFLAIQIPKIGRIFDKISVNETEKIPLHQGVASITEV